LHSPRRTLIRKTSLLHKIDPTALRSSFADALHRLREYPRTTFAGGNTRSHGMHGNSAPLRGFEKPRVALGSISSSRCQTSRAPAESQARGFVFFANDQKHSIKRAAPSGGARRDRTDDLLLAKQALSQLSYGPSPVSMRCQCLLALAGLPSRKSRQLARVRPRQSDGAAAAKLRERRLVGLGRFELPTSRLSSARSNQLSYKPEPGVSGQKPAIRGRFVVLITEY
jgi:hypothetical protein